MRNLTETLEQKLGQTTLNICRIAGGIVVLQWQVLRALFPPDFDYEESVRQFYKVGVRSLVVVMATAAFTGALMVIQTASFVNRTGATALVGWGSGTAVLAEIGPVLIGLMFSGRVGANNAAELGTMKVTDQVDALRLLAIDPIRYLIVPRFFAMVIMLVFLTCMGDLMALLGGSITASIVVGIDMRVFWQSIVYSHLLDEFIMGLVKAMVFGSGIAIVSCYFGLSTEGGAEDVGRSVNDCVVTSAITIFVMNFFVTALWT